MTGRFPGAILGVLSLLLGAVALIQSVPEVTRGIASNGWPSVEGQVQDVTFERFYDKYKRAAKYSGRVIYKYAVDGQQYTADVIGLGHRPKQESIERALDDVACYQPGQPIRVYYDPVAPEAALLVRDMPPIVAGIFIVGLAMSAIGVVVCFFAVPSAWRVWKEGTLARKAWAARYAATERDGPSAVVYEDSHALLLSTIGEVRAVYRPSRVNVTAGAAIGALLILGGVAAAVAISLAQDDFPLDATGRFAKYGTAIALGVVPPIGGFVLLIWVSRLFRHRVVMGEKGFAYVSRGCAELCTWDRILVIEECYSHESLQILKIPGAAIHKIARSLEVRRTDGKVFEFTLNSVSDLDGFARCLAEISARHGIRWETYEW